MQLDTYDREYSSVSKIATLMSIDANSIVKIPQDFLSRQASGKLSWESQIIFPEKSRKKSMDEHVVICANLFNKDLSQFDRIFNDKFDLIESGLGFAGVIFSPHCDPKSVSREGKKSVIGKKIFDEVCRKVAGCYSDYAFKKADKVCARRYQKAGILEKGESFGSKPHVYSQISFAGINLATLAYRFWDLPIQKKFITDFPNETNEVMRFSISSLLQTKKGKSIYRMECLPKSLLDMREDRSGWENAILFDGYYYRAINVRMEVGRNLFKSLVSFYRETFFHLELDDLPDIRMDTHVGVLNFFSKCLGQNIFREIPGAKLDRASVDEQSRVAYDKWGFKLFEIKKECVLPERYASIEAVTIKKAS